ncbi:MAG: TraR/DksA C4-type zinc finger protein [Bacteroidota bacterium]
MNTTITNHTKFTERYPDADLEEFRQIIQDNYKQAKEDLETLRTQIRDYSARAADDFGADYGDDSNTNSDIEMLSDMAVRKRNYIRDLENAMTRINNKSYGQCSVTGKLIPKARLLAVPTTTKSLEGKKILAGELKAKFN